MSASPSGRLGLRADVQRPLGDALMDPEKYNLIAVLMENTADILQRQLKRDGDSVEGGREIGANTSNYFTSCAKETLASKV